MAASVHILGPQFSNFVRSVQYCCEEKGIAYTLGMTLEGEPVGLRSPAHRALHPFGKVPVLLHGERRLYESVAICRYLDAAFDGPALQPADAWARAEVDQWCAVLAGYVDQALVRHYLLELVFPKGPEGRVREAEVAAATPEVARMLALLEAQLGEQAYLLGDALTLADTLAAPMLDYLANLPQAAPLLAPHPALAAYLERLRERPAGRRVLVAPSFD
ncbi:glutathione S-transferase family protein [Halomonas salifodinae]|uniref:glutathione S-transferase family protein n=1 Tax=Halomonas salifodinae TaxID=438745 RepID=UPI0033A70F03